MNFYRLELSYQGHPTTFFCKICWKEEISPRNLSNMGRASLLKIVERAYENRNRGDVLSASEYWEFFFFSLTYLRFSEVDFSKFYYQDKTVIVKKGFLKISV